MAQLIGVDLGGTAIKLGRFTVEGQLPALPWLLDC